MVYGAGFELHIPGSRLGAPIDAFGHVGAGGSTHGAWPSRRITFSYLMNQVRTVPDPRPQTLLDALVS